jgi:hypothetical protein
MAKLELSESQTGFLDGVRTDFKLYFIDMFSRVNANYKALNNRPENENIPAIPDILWQREAQDMLHKLERELREVNVTTKAVHASTKKNGSILKSVVNIWGFMGGEAKRHKD